MPQRLVNCYVLHLRPYRETSAIVTGFTEELGKVSFVVKGVRGKQKTSSAALQSFTQLQLILSGNSELKNGQKLEIITPTLLLSGNHMFSGMYLNELLMRTLPLEETLQSLWQYYQQAIKLLAQGEFIEPVLREFEFVLLEQLGYQTEFEFETDSVTAIEPGQYYHFEPESGFRRTQMPIESTISGRLLLDIVERNWHTDSLRAAKFITRTALRPLLGEKPLKSRELFR